MDKPVANWIDLFATLLHCLYQQNKRIIRGLAQSDQENKSLKKEYKFLKKIFSFSREALRDPRELEDGVYFETNTNTATKLQILKRLFELYGEDPSSVLIYLRPQKEKDSSLEEDENGGELAE